MAPSNGTNTASFPVASTSSPSRPGQVNQGSFPVASIIMLAISIIGMGILVVFVFLQHSHSSARIKQSSSMAHKDKTSPFNKHRSRVLSWFSKLHLWRSQTKSLAATKHQQGDMTTVSVLHAPCTFVAAAPSKFLAPPVVMQFRIPDTEKFVVLCSVCCPLSAHHKCNDPKLMNTFVDTPHLAHHSEQLPVNNQSSSILEREPYSVDIPLSDQGHSRTIGPPDLSHANQPRSSSIPPAWPKRTLAREDLPVLCVKTSSR